MTTRRRTFPQLRGDEWRMMLLLSSLLFGLFVVVLFIAAPLAVLIAGFGGWWIVRRHREAMAEIRSMENVYRPFLRD